MSSTNEILLLGHPFATTGMGAQCRSTVLALQCAGWDVKVFDIYGHSSREDLSVASLINPLLTKNLDFEFRVFIINGDEVGDALQHLSQNYGFKLRSGINIIYPAWELSKYPATWSKKLELFDRVWAMSKFVYKSFSSSSSSLIVDWVGQAVSLPCPPSLPRRYFNFDDSAYIFLCFLDLSSYIERKNPFGVVRAFLSAFPENDFSNVKLIIKITGDIQPENELYKLIKTTNKIELINRKFNSVEMISLISSCDCLVSLHRSEGFGRGPAEALLCGRDVIATSYSGTEDYLTDEISRKVPFSLRDLKPDDYPFATGNQWAEPSIKDAAVAMRASIEAKINVSFLGAQQVNLICSPAVVGARMNNSLKSFSL